MKCFFLFVGIGLLALFALVVTGLVRWVGVPPTSAPPDQVRFLRDRPRQVKATELLPGVVTEGELVSVLAALEPF
jgi:hypothetical protein